jgi:hypothetical protein
MVSFRVLLIALIGISIAATSDAFTTAAVSLQNNDLKTTSALYSSSIGGGGGGGDEKQQQELFKAGFLANLEMEAADLAAKKIRTIKDLGWNKAAKRAGRIRPRHWAWGGGGEKAVQDKPNYDEASSMCVEKWLSLTDFYKIVKDDTAVADTIFVALAGGGAFVERQVAEDVLAKWRPTLNNNNGKKTTFDTDAFLKTVKDGRTKFVIGWAAFSFVTGFAATGIIFPTNPVQLALVDLLESVMGNDATLAALGETRNLGL